jgi:N-acetylneuraminic acid mutarotase
MRKSVALLLVLVFLTASCLIVNMPVWAPSATENYWTTKAQMPTARNGLGLAVVDDKMYAIGGIYGTQSSYDNNEEYTPATNTWTTKKPMPTPRGDFAIAVFQDKIYTIGV